MSGGSQALRVDNLVLVPGQEEGRANETAAEIFRIGTCDRTQELQKEPHRDRGVLFLSDDGISIFVTRHQY